jgi:hypothetical protein
MAIELATIDTWIYSTLKADTTLSDLLAPDNLPAGYQRGIYSLLAPEVDQISGKQPMTPFVVFAPTGQESEHVLCGARDMVRSTYRVTVWDTQSGSLSLARAQTIMARIDTLLDRVKVTTTTPPIWCQRETLEQSVDLNNGGRTDVAVTATYTITTTE